MKPNKNKKILLSYNSRKIKKQKIGDAGLSLLNVSSFLARLVNGAIIIALMVGMISIFATPVTKDVNAIGKHYSVHIVAGQSNAVGHGTNASTDYSASPYDSQVKFYYDSGYGDVSTSHGQFVSLGAQQRPYFSNFFGPEITLGRQLASNGTQNVVIIKVAKGITSLMGDWNATTPGPMYNSLKSNVRSALSTLSAGGDTYSIDGFYWMQGESDANSGSGPWYDYNLRNLITGVRRDLNAPNMPFVIGRIKCPTCDASPAELLRNTQVSIGETVDYTRWVDTDPLALSSDNIHFSNSGEYGLGNRFFNEIWPLMKARYPTLVPDSSFSDVLANTSYRNAVNWAASSSVMTGFTNNTFRSYDNIGRSTMTQILWRMAGSPQAATSFSFRDVPSNAAYKKAVDWAKETGIVTGYSDNTFHPSELVTRKQLLQFVWRLSGSKVSTKSAQYSDVRPDTNYISALNWANEYGVLTVPPSRMFYPDLPVTRQYTVNILYNLAKNELAWKNRNTAPATVLF